MKEAPVRIGIIGTGGIAYTHARGIAEQAPSCELVAACDASEEALDRFCAEHSGTARYEGYRDLLQDRSVEAVLVALPHHLHVEACRAAFAAGKHVLLEKPIARSLDEADAIIEAAAASRRVLMVAHNQRYSPLYRTVRDLVRTDRLGTILSASIDHHQNFDRPEGHWWRSREMVGGGCVIGSGIHRLDLLNWYLGAPERVYAVGVSEPSRLEAEAIVSAVITFQGGVVADFSCNWAACRPPRSRTAGGEGFSIFGASGALYVEEKDTVQLATRGAAGESATVETIEIEAESAGPSMWEHFALCVRDGATPLTDGASARRALALVAAIYRSMETGGPVDLPSA
jgi:predicted dehydrogenase